MEPYQERVIQEKRELDERLKKLDAFIVAGTERWDKVPAEEQERLCRQAEIMTDYSAILGERIAAFGK